MGVLVYGGCCVFCSFLIRSDAGPWMSDVCRFTSGDRAHGCCVKHQKTKSINDPPINKSV